MKKQNEIARQMILKTGNHAGAHNTDARDYEKGHKRRPKHKKKVEQENESE